MSTVHPLPHTVGTLSSGEQLLTCHHTHAHTHTDRDWQQPIHPRPGKNHSHFVVLHILPSKRTSHMSWRECRSGTNRNGRLMPASGLQKARTSWMSRFDACVFLFGGEYASQAFQKRFQKLMIMPWVTFLRGQVSNKSVSQA